MSGSPEGSQLRFDESVPVEQIQLRAPELEGDDKNDYEVIGEKVTYRLAQKPASFVLNTPVFGLFLRCDNRGREDLKKAMRLALVFMRLSYKRLNILRSLWLAIANINNTN